MNTDNTEPRHRDVSPINILYGAIVGIFAITVMLLSYGYFLPTRTANTTASIADSISERHATVTEVRSLNDRIREELKLLSQASGNDKNAIQERLKTLLVERRGLVADLASNNPKGFSRIILNDRERELIPVELNNLVEQHVTIKDMRIGMIHEDDFEKPDNSHSEFVGLANDKNYDLRFVNPTNVSIDQNIEATGELVDDIFVVYADSSVVGPSTLAWSVSATQPLKTLVLLIDFNDSPARSKTKTEVGTWVTSSLNPKFAEISYNKFSLVPTVREWYRVNRNGFDGTTCQRLRLSDTSAGQSELTSALSGVDLSTFGSLIVVQNLPSGCSPKNYAGAGLTIAGRNYSTKFANVSGFIDSNAVHEVGHIVGLSHANAIECGSVATGGTCTNVEYGNRFDVMGSGANAGGWHVTGYSKRLLNWIPSSDALSITSSGTYTLVPLEKTSGPRVAFIRSPNSSVKYYEVEYRQPTGLDSALSSTSYIKNLNGLFINIVATQNTVPDPLAYGIHIVDTQPADRDGYLDWNSVALTDSRTFTDSALGITIGPIRYVDANSIKFDVVVGGAPIVDPTPTPTTTDTTPPVVRLTNPQTGDILSTTKSTTLSAVATDNVKVSRVVFMANGISICSSNVQSGTNIFSCSWTPSSRKMNYSLKAIAYDSSGNQASSNLISVKTR